MKVTLMKVIFWWPRFKLPQSLKRQICLCIKNNYSGHSFLNSQGLSFRIHFDVMRRKRDGSMGWYAGYVDTWLRWRPGKRRRHIVVQVLDYGKEII